MTIQPPAITRTTEALRAARENYASLSAQTRLRIRGCVVLVVSVFAAGYLAAGAFTLWREVVGPLLWDSIHGDRAATTTLGALTAAVIVGAWTLRVLGRTAAPYFDTTPTPALGGAATGGVGVGTARAGHELDS